MRTKLDKQPEVLTLQEPKEEAMPEITYIKMQAKRLKKELNIKHGQALDLISKQYGHKDWNVFSALLKEKKNGT